MSHPCTFPIWHGELMTGLDPEGDPRRMQGPMLEVSRRLNEDAAEPPREGSPIMKRTIAAMALCGCLAGGHASAQSPVYGPTAPPQMPANPATSPPGSGDAATPPPGTQRVYRAN